MIKTLKSNSVWDWDKGIFTREKNQTNGAHITAPEIYFAFRRRLVGFLRHTDVGHEGVATYKEVLV